jgi:hypothetical protein
MKPDPLPKNLDALNKRLERLARTTTRNREPPIAGVKTLNKRVARLERIVAHLESRAKR